jgi:hypothetical protein
MSRADFRLADGRPLWYALLHDPSVLVIDAASADRARGELRDKLRIEPDVVQGCIGCSLENAREMLWPIKTGSGHL